MISFYNMTAVARYEAKTLLRSWFFRIFSILSILFIGFFDFGVLSGVTHAPWSFKGVPSSIPYLNILLLNVAQAIIAVFLSSDFLKRDKKLDTTEVVYMRSMTNADYVAGKTLGIMSIFLLLNAVILLVGAIFNIFFAGVPLVLEAYLIYPLLISVPTLFFILGLSFLLMNIVRNQAVTFIILLGYIGLTIFYLGPRANDVFDYVSYNIPLMYSGFTGFADTWRLLAQRAVFLLLGLSFMSISMTMLRRLPQSRAATSLARVSSVVLIAAALFLAVLYAGSGRRGGELRERMLEASERAARNGTPTPRAVDMRLVHRGGSVECSAGISITNDTGNSLGTYVFRLNPGMEVSSAEGGSGALDIERDEHILYLTPASPLPPGGSDSISVSWKGDIDDEACYPDVEDEQREKPNRIQFYDVGKKHSYVDGDYVLLTPETMWYPAAGPGYVPSRPAGRRKDFILFDLEVDTRHGMTAVSQGEAVSGGPGTFRFEADRPIPALSLVIAEFERMTTVVDSVEYNIYVGKGHDYFSRYFTEMEDTLGGLISRSRETYEARLGLEYPFRRFSIVEVPVHFVSYRHMWTVHQETVQPEIVLLPEKGVTLRGTDFQRMERFGERRRERRNEDESPVDDQIRMFSRFTDGVLLGSFGRVAFRSEDPFELTTSYNVFPNLLDFTWGIEPDDWPVLNMAIEAFYAARLEEAPSDFMRFIFGLSPEEKVNIELSRSSLEDIMSDPDRRTLAHFALRQKGDQLLTTVENVVGREEMDRFMREVIDRYRFAGMPEEEFLSSVRDRFGIDLAARLSPWYEGTSLPGYVISAPKAWKVVEDDRERHQVILSISNPEDVAGLVKLTFGRGGERRRGRFGPMSFLSAERSGEGDIEEYVSFAPGESKELGFLLDFQPTSLRVNTMVSRNLPSVVDVPLPDEFEMRRRAVPFDGERVLEEPVSLEADGEIVVDNEDAGFGFDEGGGQSLLSRILPDFAPESDYRYVGTRFWRENRRWQPTLNTKFHGRYIRSAHFISGGKGEMKAWFDARIPESGTWDVYYHVARIESPWERRRDSEVKHGTIRVRVNHDDGVEEIPIDLDRTDDGWTYLGSFYISSGGARVEVTDDSDARMVTADAVRWVRR